MLSGNITLSTKYFEILNASWIGIFNFGRYYTEK
jgi:hypothetical protein